MTFLYVTHIANNIASKKLAVFNSNPWPKSDFTITGLNNAERTIEKDSNDIEIKKVFGSKSIFFSLNEYTICNIAASMRPSTMIEFLAKSRDVKLVGIKNSGDNKTTVYIRNEEKSFFFIDFGYL